tara:strand:+ start:598 stop:1272 length:675 start_codon:yes stop_codon:yes gene_type:complete
MEDIGTIFRNLGKNLSSSDSNEELEALKQKLNDVQSEMYGTIESLLARVRSLEDQLAELKVKGSEDKNEFTNVFELMSPEELLGRSPQPIEPLLEEDVISVKGFVAPPPVKEEIEIDLPEEEEVIEKEEVEPEDPYEILNDDDPNHLDASEIITYIESYGGILNQEMKKKEVLRSDISDKDRKIVYELLERCGVKTYKVNKFRTFFYYGTEEEGEKKYEKYMAK